MAAPPSVRQHTRRRPGSDQINRLGSRTVVCPIADYAFGLRIEPFTEHRASRIHAHNPQFAIRIPQCIFRAPAGGSSPRPSGRRRSSSPPGPRCRIPGTPRDAGGLEDVLDIIGKGGKPDVAAKGLEPLLLVREAGRMAKLTCSTASKFRIRPYISPLISWPTMRLISAILAASTSPSRFI